MPPQPLSLRGRAIGREAGRDDDISRAGNAETTANVRPLVSKRDASTTGALRSTPGGSLDLTFSDHDKFDVGCTVGGGLDHALTEKASVGVEYRYFDLGKETDNLDAVTGTATTGASTVSNNHRFK